MNQRNTLCYPLGLSVRLPRKNIGVFLAVTRKGSAAVIMPPTTKLYSFENNVLFICLNAAKSLFYTYFSLLSNLFADLCYGCVAVIQLNGVGFKVFRRGRLIEFRLGYTHDIFVTMPKEVLFAAVGSKNTRLYVKALNRQTLGVFISKLISLRVPDAYKGKGVYLAPHKPAVKQGKKAYR